MEDSKIVKRLTSVEREVVDNIVNNGMEWEEAYAMANGQMSMLNEETKASFKKKCNALIQRPHVFAYYQAIQKEVLDAQVSKSVWTKELAEKKLLGLIDRIEGELDNGEKLTMTRVQGFIQCIKELNTMNGLNEINQNINNGVMIQIVGEENIPK